MQYNKARYIKAFTLLLAIGLLGACTTTQLKPVTEKYTGAPAGKGLVAVSLGYKTIHPDNKFIDVPIFLYFNGTDVKKEAAIQKMLSTHSYQFKETSQPNYKNHDFIIEFEAGEYSVNPARTGAFVVLKPQPSKFEVKHGYITYIGQYDIEATVKGKDLFTRSIRKRTSHTRDQESKNIEDIVAQYPNLEYEGVLKQLAPKGDYRMRSTVSPNTNIYIHTYSSRR